VTTAIKRPEVSHDAFAPEKCVVCLAAGHIGFSHNIASIVNPDWSSIVASQGAEVSKNPALPEKWMERQVPSQVRLADDLSPVVSALCETDGSPRVPRSIIVPFSQRNGSWVGNCVISFGIEFVSEAPTTSLLSHE
jgi:hypothetical protein